MNHSQLVWTLAQYRHSLGLYYNKKAELPQRLPCDAPYNMGAMKILRVPEYAHGYFARSF